MDNWSTAELIDMLRSYNYYTPAEARSSNNCPARLLNYTHTIIINILGEEKCELRIRIWVFMHDINKYDI